MIKKEFKFSNVGSMYEPVLKPVADENGAISIVEVGKTDLRAEINSHALECDINYLVQRAVNGEPDVLNQRKAFYGDFTQFPKTYAEVLQRVIDAKDIFDKLPVENRANFDNDVYKFIASMDSEDWLTKAGFVEKNVDEVKSDES